jgi:hypothetical protein
MGLGGTDLDSIYRKRFNKELADEIRGSRLRTDGSRIVTTDRLSQELLLALWSRKICAVRIPEYCPAAVAERAGRWILKHSKVVNWHIPQGRNRIKTDMNYGIGMPRQVAASHPAAARRYIRDAVASIRKVRDAFAPSLSPIDRLRLELDELWPAGANVAPFEGHNGFVGLVRIMKPETLFGGVAGRRGVCHVDASSMEKTFSANIYVDLPKAGGELSIWNIALDGKTARHPIYHLLARPSEAFDEEIQEIIHHRLPAPLKIKPRLGELVILDTSRPHAVTGFSRGSRISIQSFLSFSGKSAPIGIFS